jgi:hypothetical protein
MKKVSMNKQKIITISLVVLTVVILAAALRGLPGNPSSEELNGVWSIEGSPLETSNERGRFALTYSIIENKSLMLAVPLARFSTPDLATVNAKYVSLFPPGVSFLIIPGYLIGKLIGASQIGAYVVVSLFAVLNLFLIRSLAIRLGAHPLAANLGGFAFLFATPAFSYGVSLYQHHFSVFLILFSLYMLLRWNNLWSLTVVWFLCGLSVIVDNPNFFMMLPIALFALSRIIWIARDRDWFSLTVRYVALITLGSVLVPAIFFAWYNLAAHGSPWQLSGTLERVLTIDENGQTIDLDAKEALVGNSAEQDVDVVRKKTAVGFFATRNMLNGLYIHTISLDRGVLWFTPVILLGVFGLSFTDRTKARIGALLVSIIGVNVVLYSMWGDPWGGWAFGSRYMIPTYAMLAIGLAVTLSRWRGKRVLLVVFLGLFCYSAWVNSLGAITSNSNPPEMEALALEELTGQEQKYTYARNFDYLISNQSKSLVWQTVARKYVSATTYHWLLTSIILVIAAVITYGLASSKPLTKEGIL